jgi:hypothetical protein
MAKRTYPWLLATVAVVDNFSSPLARQMVIQVFQRQRSVVMAPYSQIQRDSNVTKTSSTDAERPFDLVQMQTQMQIP